MIINKTILMLLFSIVLLYIPCAAGAGGSQSATSETRGRYLAGRGIIVPPEEIHTDSYIASIDYKYPQPAAEFGVYLYNSTNLMSRQGQEGILQIGLQGRKISFESLPAMNLAFVIDTSDSMNEEDKIAWVKESVAIFMNKVRDVDSLALVSFNDSVQVLFESTRMDSPQKRRRFLNAVQNLSPRGGTDIEKGLAAGYEQVLANYRAGSVNRVFFFSDGTEFSSRLNLAGAQSGEVRVSLLWNNVNDLDLHVVNPRQEEIFYGHRNDSYGGMLDVDMNAGGELTNKPVENIFWIPGKTPQGKYRVYVQNFGFHEKDRSPTNFQVEIKNGNEYSRFEGTISGSGRASNTEIGTFEYKSSAALKQEKDLVYQLAETYKEMGISISTLGVGLGFDVELMRKLAEEGGGSSRFISSREEMQKTFDTEFDRMAVLVASDVEMDLELMPGAEVLDTWGYQYQINGNKIAYRLTGLHLGDYETILIRYRLPPQGTGNEKRLAGFRLSAKDILGKTIRLPEQTISIGLSDSPVPVDGISSGMVLYSGTMMHFAEALKEIGTLYYAGQDDLNGLSQLERESGGREPSADARQRMDTLKDTFFSRLEKALQKTNSNKAELENAKLRLDDKEAFNHEIEILARYQEILIKEIRDNGGVLKDETLTVGDSGTDGVSLPNVSNSGPPQLEVLRNRVSGLFKEITLSLPEEQRSVVALTPFITRSGEEPLLLNFLNESALVALSSDPRLLLVERSLLDKVRQEQQIQLVEVMDADTAVGIGKLLGARFIITGQVIPLRTQVMVFGRVINVETGEIVSAAQIYLDREVVGELL
ncbi:MAG: VWA domain-containing protein [Treponema sp.]|jgi:Ca-activated chloride channel family protein|nr:VWA domain-containing protein [Treponema sp.]